jgi:hypothetical protein
MWVETGIERAAYRSHALRTRCFSIVVMTELKDTSGDPHHSFEPT